MSEEAAAAKAPKPGGSLTGTWKVTSILPDGGETQHLLHLKQEGEKVSGSSEFTERSIDLSRGSFADGAVGHDLDAHHVVGIGDLG